MIFENDGSDYGPAKTWLRRDTSTMRVMSFNASIHILDDGGNAGSCVRRRMAAARVV